MNRGFRFHSCNTTYRGPMSIRKEDLDLENPFNNFKYILSVHCDE